VQWMIEEDCPVYLPDLLEAAAIHPKLLYCLKEKGLLECAN